MDFYYSPRGSGCRTVIMVAKALGLELNKKLVSTLNGDQLKPEFVKLNPQHTIPTLVDNGFSVWESRAIAVYLIEQYGKDDSLFPKDPKKQAVVNQRLYFDMGTLYDSFANYYYPLYRTGKCGSDEDFKKIATSFEYLNTFLEGQDYVAGEHLTVADIAILSSVSTFEIFDFDLSKYPNVDRWYANAKKVAPGWDENWSGLLELKALSFFSPEGTTKHSFVLNMDYYYLPKGSGCRTVLMVAKAIGIELNKKLLNTSKGEHLTPEFLKLNPQHTIPTLVDNGFAVWESRAIAVYLVEKYAKEDSLYPKDPQQRALINQRLYFDLGTLFDSLARYYYPILRTGHPGSSEDWKKVEAAFKFLNIFLEGQDYVAGSHLTVADIAILSTVSTFEIVDFDISKYPNVARWYANAQKVTPGWEENWEGLQQMKQRFEIGKAMAK
ncbi:uncharacterized protein LOC108027230 [Drosophila biarmipes]|uniref:uncharacterized protein LOC108027230 n=1 Tax=Drosophila biarmipes TaxID=125945 RepID=UPI0007E5DBBE|nr:uncharacterized protein LOC108027230 [Drosophila biarmipes]